MEDNRPRECAACHATEGLHPQASSAGWDFPLCDFHVLHMDTQYICQVCDGWTDVRWTSADVWQEWLYEQGLDEWADLADYFGGDYNNELLWEAMFCRELGRGLVCGGCLDDGHRLDRVGDTK